MIWYILGIRTGLTLEKGVNVVTTEIRVCGLLVKTHKEYFVTGLFG